MSCKGQGPRGAVVSGRGPVGGDVKGAESGPGTRGRVHRAIPVAPQPHGQCAAKPTIKKKKLTCGVCCFLRGEYSPRPESRPPRRCHRTQSGKKPCATGSQELLRVGLRTPLVLDPLSPGTHGGWSQSLGAQGGARAPGTRTKPLVRSSLEVLICPFMNSVPPCAEVASELKCDGVRP